MREPSGGGGTSPGTRNQELEIDPALRLVGLFHQIPQVRHHGADVGAAAAGVEPGEAVDQAEHGGRGDGGQEVAE